jgi:general secretion pathway protein N
LLAAVAGWALLVWVGGLANMGGAIARLPDDPSLLRKLPVSPRAQPERIGPATQYAEVATRPLFSEDRRPQPFSLQPQGEGEDAQAFDFVLTSVLLAPDFKMAIVQPAAGGDSIRMKLDEAPAEAQGWRLVDLQPRSAVFAGPQGEKHLELRPFDGKSGAPPTQRTPRSTGDIQPPPQPISMQDADEAVQPPVAVEEPAPAKPPTTGSTLPDTPMTPEAQMEAIRKRIEERRAQLRNEAQRQQQQNPSQQEQP